MEGSFHMWTSSSTYRKWIVEHERICVCIWMFLNSNSRKILLQDFLEKKNYKESLKEFLNAFMKDVFNELLEGDLLKKIMEKYLKKLLVEYKTKSLKIFWKEFMERTLEITPGQFSEANPTGICGQDSEQISGKTNGKAYVNVSRKTFWDFLKEAPVYLKYLNDMWKYLIKEFPKKLRISEGTPGIISKVNSIIKKSNFRINPCKNLANISNKIIIVNVGTGRW